MWGSLIGPMNCLVQEENSPILFWQRSPSQPGTQRHWPVPSIPSSQLPIPQLQAEKQTWPHRMAEPTELEPDLSDFRLPASNQSSNVLKVSVSAELLGVWTEPISPHWTKRTRFHTKASMLDLPGETGSVTESSRRVGSELPTTPAERWCKVLPWWQTAGSWWGWDGLRFYEEEEEEEQPVDEWSQLHPSFP